VEWVEVTAKTIEAAKDRALDRLGVDERDAEFEVLEEPRTGFLGRVKGEARVRARVRPQVPRPKAERRDRGRRGGRGQADTSEPRRGGRTRSSAGAGSGPADGPVEVAHETDAPVARDRERPTEDEGSGPRTAGGTSRRRNRRRPSGRPGTGDTGDTADRGTRSSNVDADDTDSANEGKDMADLPIDAQAQIVATFLEGLVDAFGLSGATTWTQVDDDTAEVQVDGSELGLLVGPKGRTLQAVSEVARSVVVHKADGITSGRVHIDVAGYRRRRREALVRFTAEIAEQVRSTGEAVAMEPMSAPDRKVIHDAVNDLDGVGSTSEGEEPYRRVVITPAS
jgi:spoIIIJ-associated protein